MKTIITSFLILLAVLSCTAKSVTIIPQYTVGDTFRYHVESSVSTYMDNDSIVVMTSMYPTLVVDSKNDMGYIVSITNKIETTEVETSKKDLLALIPIDSEEITSSIEDLKLIVQLDENCRPDSMNLEEAIQHKMSAIVKYMARQEGIDLSNEAGEDWVMENKPLISELVTPMCTMESLLDEQFGNTSYFNFIGVPLKNGNIAKEKVLAKAIMALCYNATDLEMTIEENESDTQTKTTTIDISSKSKNCNIKGAWSFENGILTQAELSIVTHIVDNFMTTGTTSLKLLK